MPLIASIAANCVWQSVILQTHTSSPAPTGLQHFVIGYSLGPRAHVSRVPLVYSHRSYFICTLGKRSDCDTKTNQFEDTSWERKSITLQFLNGGMDHVVLFYNTSFLFTLKRITVSPYQGSDNADDQTTLPDVKASFDYTRIVDYNRNLTSYDFTCTLAHFTILDREYWQTGSVGIEACNYLWVMAGAEQTISLLLITVTQTLIDSSRVKASMEGFCQTDTAFFSIVSLWYWLLWYTLNKYFNILVY